MASKKSRLRRDDNPEKTTSCEQKHEVTECAICLEVIEDRSDTSEGQRLGLLRGGMSKMAAQNVCWAH